METDKGLVLNKTNAAAIAKTHGDDSDEWIGQAIELYPAVTQFNGNTVDCIRVRASVAPAAGGDIPF